MWKEESRRVWRRYWPCRCSRRRFAAMWTRSSGRASRAPSAANVGVFVPWDDLLDEDKEDGELYESAAAANWKRRHRKLLLLCACLLLAYEANQVVRFGGETPGMDFVLGRKPEIQVELGEESVEYESTNKENSGIES